MSETSRRKLLAAGGAGVAAGAVGLTMSPAQAGETRRTASSAQESVVAYVRDHRSSEVRLMVGEREVVVHDRDLATRILNAAGGE
ncbi:MAG TPA: twin-arginine translocation signal domain-containing protein [Nocardioides sp.]|uniref:twin-arginine translocation signal domain-containing protein n=1 Tax=Nocardioides sp. TaxID=35761 RepID=UPI002F3EA442